MAGKTEGNFEVHNTEIEKKMNEIGRKIGSSLPEGWGFTLLISNHSNGDMFYISSCNREDMKNAMLNFITRKDKVQ